MFDERPINPFPPSIREKFFDMITAEGYKCKERVHPEKIRQYILFLDDPNKKPERGNQAESKLRYDAFKFYELRDNKLYRKPEGKYPEPRLVVYQNEAFDIITRKHLHLGHPGRDPVFLALDPEVYGIKRDECYWVKDHCMVCNLNVSNNSKPPLTAIEVNQTFERVQIDLIDMRHTPSDRYHWILHIKDHWSKYSQLYPLQGKEATPIADYIALWIMAFFPMKILQCDNGKEFKGKTHASSVRDIILTNISRCIAYSSSKIWH